MGFEDAYEVVRSEELDGYHSEHDVFCERLVSHELRDLAAKTG